MSERSYIPVDLLAKGGMGSVELVVRSEGRFRRSYARKRLLPVHRDDPDLREMFLEEARLAGLIRHRNVVSVLDVGEDEEGPFLVMELIEGVPLSKLIVSAREAPLPLATCLEIAAQVAEGLSAAHELTSPEGEHLRVIHRDLSPSNVLIGFDGCVRITDFGIAKAAGQSIHTQTGVLKGKPSYMSPEQLRFDDIDQRSDFFSLGLLVFEMLSGRRAYASGGVEFAAVARRILHEPPPDIAEIRPEAPDGLTELLFELLAKTAEDRPSSAIGIAERLRALADEVSADETPIPLAHVLEMRFGEERVAQETRFKSALNTLDTRSTPQLRPKRGRIYAVGIAAALLASGVSAVIALSEDRETPAPRTVVVETAPPEAPLEAPIPPVVEPAIQPEPAAPPVAERPAPRRARDHAPPEKRRAMGRWEWPEE